MKTYMHIYAENKLDPDRLLKNPPKTSSKPKNSTNITTFYHYFLENTSSQPSPPWHVHHDPTPPHQPHNDDAHHFTNLQDQNRPPVTPTQNEMHIIQQKEKNSKKSMTQHLKVKIQLFDKGETASLNLTRDLWLFVIHTFLIYITTTPRVRLCLAHVAFSNVQATGERGMLVAHLHNGKRKSFSTYIIRSPQSNSPHNLWTFAYIHIRNSRENIKKHICVHNYITIYLVFEIRMYFTLTIQPHTCMCTQPHRTVVMYNM